MQSTVFILIHQCIINQYYIQHLFITQYCFFFMRLGL